MAKITTVNSISTQQPSACSTPSTTAATTSSSSIGCGGVLARRWSRLLNRNTKEFHAILLGPGRTSRVGRNSIFYTLKFGEPLQYEDESFVSSTEEQQQFQVAQTDYNDELTITLWDDGCNHMYHGAGVGNSGGSRSKQTHLWRFYVAGNNVGRIGALIYVVDASADDNGMIRARKELEYLLELPELERAKLLVLSNKCDLPQARPHTQVAKELGLYNLSHRIWHLQPCSVFEQDTLYEGLNWLVHALHES